MEVESDFLYTKEHEWVSIDGNIAIVGVSDYAQEQLGDITFIELPAVNDEIDQFGELASVESVKAASDIFSPISGRITEINNDLEESPELINKSPYERGWIAKIEISDLEESSNLLTAEEYEKYLQTTG